MYNMRVSILYLCVAVIFVLALLFINTGIDLFDEGYYLLGYDREQPIFFQFTGFHFLIRYLPFSDHLILARLYRIFLLILVAFIFAKSLHKYVFKFEHFGLVLGYVFLGNFLTYVHCPPSISYNTLSVLFLELLVATYLPFREKGFGGKKNQILQIILFGVLLGFIAFNKATSAAAIVLLFGIDQLIYNWKRWGAYLFVLFIVGISSIITLLILVYASYGYTVFEITRLLTQTNNPFNEGHLDSKFMFGQLFLNTFIQSKKYILFTLAYIGTYIIFKQFKLVNSNLLVVFFSFITLVVFYFYRNVYFGQPGAEYMYSFGLFMLFAWSYEQWKTRTISNSNVDYHFVFMLFLLPFAGFWGSNNPPMLGVIHYMVFMLLLLFYLDRYLQFRFFLFFPILISGFVVYNFLWAPFYNPPVFDQNKTVDVRGSKIKVSNYIYQRSVAFDSIKTKINHNLPLIQINVPNGLLYMNRLHNYLTLYFNTPEFTNGYLQLLKLKGIPDRAQVLLYKNNESKIVENLFQQFQIELSKKNYKFILIAEAGEYRLFELKYLDN